MLSTSDKKFIHYTIHQQNTRRRWAWKKVQNDMIKWEKGGKKTRVTSNAFLKKSRRRFSCFCRVEPAPIAVSLNTAMDFWNAASCASLRAAYNHHTIRKHSTQEVGWKTQNSLPQGALNGQKKTYKHQLLNHMLSDILLLQHSAKQLKPQGSCPKD